MDNILRLALLVVLILTMGCTTKKHVNQKVVPIIDKVNALDQRAASNTRDLATADETVEKNLSALESRIAQVNENVTTASRRAEQASQTDNGVSARTDSLANTIKNLDNYQSIGEVSILFPVEGDQLDQKAIVTIDEFAARVPGTGDYVLTLEGSTDAAGGPEHNYDLSKRRAQAVARYLATKLRVSPYRIFSVGLGPDKPVAENKTTSGRAKNRRVAIGLFTNAPATQANEEPEENAAVK